MYNLDASRERDNTEAASLYWREKMVFDKANKWPPWVTLSEKDKDYWRACVQRSYGG